MTFVTAEQPKPAAPRTAKAGAIRFRPKLLLAIALVFALQVALVILLGNPHISKPSPNPLAPTIHFAGNESSELLALQDPTLFLLPHYDNFSAAWLRIPALSNDPALWAEPARQLLMPGQLGMAFTAFMRTNPPPPHHTEIASESDWPDLPSAPRKSISTPSTLRMEGPLAKRRLITPVHLPSQVNTNSDVLPNSEVQVIVNAQGNPLSAVVTSDVPSDADAAAMAFAKSARFEPLKAAALGAARPDEMTFGKMIFEWQTVPPAATNSPASP